MELQDDELAIDDIISVLKSYWKMIIIPAVIVASAVFFYFHLSPPRYESYSLIRIGTNSGKTFESVASIREIMNSYQTSNVLTEKGNLKGQGVTISVKPKSIEFTETSDLMRISAVDMSPEKALLKVQAATDFIFERHKILYTSALKELEILIRYVKEVVNPVPLSSSMNDFRMVPSKIEVEPSVSNIPVARKDSLVFVIVFFIVMFCDILGAFYLAGSKKRKVTIHEKK